MEDDDLPQLSVETFAALQEFYKEQKEREDRSSLMVNSITESITVEEDWQLSQFWYDSRTTEILVSLALKVIGTQGKVALVSCPSLYPNMKHRASKNCEVTLYEYDKRFSIYGNDFVFYDYRCPLSIPRDKSNYYDLVIVDPPFLSEECLTKTAATVKFLTKRKILLCTGAVMCDLANQLLDVEKCTFEPKHRNNLANEFCCFSNFKVEGL